MTRQLCYDAADVQGLPVYLQDDADLENTDVVLWYTVGTHHIVRRRRVHHMHHPVAGDLELSYDKFILVGADRQMLVIYQAEPGSRSEEALTFLAATMASPRTAENEKPNQGNTANVPN